MFRDAMLLGRCLPLYPQCLRLHTQADQAHNRMQCYY